MQALTGITSRLDNLQSFLDDKIADTPLAVDEEAEAAAQREEDEAAAAARRRLPTTASADAIKDELLGAVQEDDDDDDLETDALKAENARLKREVRSLTTDLESAERDGSNYRDEARDAKKNLASLRRDQAADDDGSKAAEAALRRDLADAEAGATKAAAIATAARDAEVALRQSLDDERRKTKTLSEQLGDERDALIEARDRASRADADAGSARREAALRDEVASLAAALVSARAEPPPPTIDADAEIKRRRTDERYGEALRRVAELEREAQEAQVAAFERADVARITDVTMRERRQKDTAAVEAERQDLETSVLALQRERDTLDAKLRAADATINAAQQRSQQAQLPPQTAPRDGALAAQLMRKQAQLDAATSDRDGLRSSLAAQRRANESLRVELDEARRSRADDPRGLRRRLKLHRAPNAGLGGAVDTVDQWMASALRLLNSSPIFRLVFFAWIVLHHVYVFMVFFYHHLPHIGGGAPPRLRGRAVGVDALG